MEKLKLIRKKKQKIESLNQQTLKHGIDLNLVKKAERKRARELDLAVKDKAEALGQDYERISQLKYSIQDSENYHLLKRQRKQVEDHGFLSFAESSYKKYKRMISDLKPDLEMYKLQKTKAVESNSLNAFYGDSFEAPNYVVREKDLVKMSKDVVKQCEIRGKYSRRRAWDPDENVTFINDKNRNFNKKISRAFDKYTKEIKESLERGTAL